MRPIGPVKQFHSIGLFPFLFCHHECDVTTFMAPQGTRLRYVMMFNHRRVGLGQHVLYALILNGSSPTTSTTQLLIPLMLCS